MTRKFIFFDIDGTLLDDNKKVLASTREALRGVREAGHVTAIATGRNAYMADEIIKDLEFDHYIVCNGAEAFYNHESTYRNPLDEGALKQILEIADKQKHPVIYETAHKLLRRSEESSERVVEGMKFVGHYVPTHDETGIFHLENELIQLLLFINEDENIEHYHEKFPAFRFVRWHEDAVDVLPADGSKFETIKILAQSQGFAKEDIITIGDGNNDFEMVLKAHHGIAMGNAVESVKEVADYVTDTNNNDGIYKALKRLDLF